MEINCNYKDKENKNNPIFINLIFITFELETLEIHIPTAWNLQKASADFQITYEQIGEIRFLINWCVKV